MIRIEAFPGYRTEDGWGRTVLVNSVTGETLSTDIGNYLPSEMARGQKGEIKITIEFIPELVHHPDWLLPDGTILKNVPPGVRLPPGSIRAKVK